jgi:hypothetical protein
MSGPKRARKQGGMHAVMDRSIFGCTPQGELNKIPFFSVTLQNSPRGPHEDRLAKSKKTLRLLGFQGLF